MARKTKTDTEQTRLQIIAAARRMFAQRGVSRTTFAQIAAEAAVSRGAIYWHFKNKPELFFAVMEQVSLPLIARMDERLPADDNGDPLQSIASSMIEILYLIENDDVARTTFEIVMLKCEYVDEFASLDLQVIKTGCAFMQQLTRSYENARKRGLLRDDLDPAQCALDSYLFMKGLMQLWLSDHDAVIVRSQARAAIEAHVGLRRKT
jgi:TetR/AcrR family acrAB operon transcriptional repressor